MLVAGVVAACSHAERVFLDGAESAGGTPGGSPGAGDAGGSAGDDAQSGLGGADGPGAAPGDDTGGGGSAAGGDAVAGAGSGSPSTSTCEPGETRTCGEAGFLGACARGEQSCEADGRWSECSKQPASEDTCVKGNDDDCDGMANGGCRCIEDVTRIPCGDCDEGTRVCKDGRQNSYGECMGAIPSRTFYRDADGDGYGSVDQGDQLKWCSDTPDAPPAGYVERGGDCCDVADMSGSKVLPAMIHPAVRGYFASPADICGVGWDYDCSGVIQTDPVKRLDVCCVDEVFVEDDCGKTFAICSCSGCVATGTCGPGVLLCR